MKRFNKILKNIKDSTAKDSPDIAILGIKAYLLQHDKDSVKKILSQIPTCPLIHNSIKILEKSEKTKKKSEKLIDYIKKSQKKITKKGVNLIKRNMNVFVYSPSSTIIDILNHAQKKKKKFIVYNLETSDLINSKQFSQEAKKTKTKLIQLQEDAFEFSLKNCDLFLFGSDAFLRSGSIAKRKTRKICNILNLYKIPTYSCGISLKYTKKTKINHSNSELINKKLITGVVSEFGVLHYKDFLKKSKNNLQRFLK